ncbi:hypothetical protein CD790_18800 [Streptomyces sp. SAJ15]|nr:hypothetical protein CD790_18800 [Streptomyces sp. SAJ15]
MGRLGSLHALRAAAGLEALPLWLASLSTLEPWLRSSILCRVPSAVLGMRRVSRPSLRSASHSSAFTVLGRLVR